MYGVNGENTEYLLEKSSSRWKKVTLNSFEENFGEIFSETRGLEKSWLKSDVAVVFVASPNKFWIAKIPEKKEKILRPGLQRTKKFTLR